MDTQPIRPGRLKPPVRRAMEYLQRRATPPDGGRLPPILQMAREAGVGPRAMVAAVAAMHRSRRLTVRRGVGVFRGPPSTAPSLPQAPPTTPLWRATAQRLLADTLQDSPASKPSLATAKELCTRYRVNPRTLRKALAWLEREHGVHRRAVLDRVLTGRGSRSRVYLLAWGESTGELSFANPWACHNLRLLERECVRAGVGLVTLAYNAESPMPRFITRDGSVRRGIDSDALGVVIWTIGFWKTVREVIRVARGYGAPMAVLDEEGQYDIASWTAGCRQARVFSFSTGAGAPRAVARYLLTRGYRRLTYVSITHGAPWSRRRYDQLDSAVRAAGIDQGVGLVALESARDTAALFSDKRLQHATERALTASGTAGSGITRTRWREFSRELSAHALDSMRQVIRREELDALFLRALDSGSDCWVCADDTVALAAQSWLRTRGVAVPERVAVIGFDDLPESAAANLTSCNFDVEGLANAMLAHVLRPRSSPRDRVATEVQGMIMERGTT